MKLDQLRPNQQIVPKSKAQQPAKEMVRINRLRPQPGQKVYKIDIITRVVEEAVLAFANAVYPLGKSTTKHKYKLASKRINVEEGSFYVCALNERNALKHFDKIN